MYEAEMRNLQGGVGDDGVGVVGHRRRDRQWWSNWVMLRVVDRDELCNAVKVTQMHPLVVIVAESEPVHLVLEVVGVWRDTRIAALAECTSSTDKAMYGPLAAGVGVVDHPIG